jgi:hypothetical protein
MEIDNQQQHKEELMFLKALDELVNYNEKAIEENEIKKQEREDKITHKDLCEMMIELWEKEIRLVQSGLGFDIPTHKQIVKHYKQILKKLK